MSQGNEGKWDGHLLQMAQQHNGIDDLLNTLFEFLARKTDFYTGIGGDKAESVMQEAFKKNKVRAQEYHKKSQAEKEAQQEVIRERERAKEQKQREQDEVDKERLRKAREEKDKKAQPKIVDVTDEEEEKERASASGAASSSSAEDADKDKDEKDEDKKDDKEKKEGGIKPNAGNGGETDSYKWSQTLQELTVTIRLGGKYKKQDLVVKYTTDHLTVGLKNQPPLVDGKMFAKVQLEDCNWTIEDEGRACVLYLQKVNQMEWWKYVVEGEAPLDLQKVEPENSKLDDLDGETRQTVEKMMFDQKQKALGLPTSDEMQKRKQLENFMKMHPEMDFSKAKFC